MSDSCPLTTLGELSARAEWTLTDDEKVAAQARILDASDLAREESGTAWTPDTVPAWARRAVIAAVLRVLRNPAGYIQAASGDESVRRAFAYDDVAFTSDELAKLHGWRDRKRGGGRLAAVRTETTFAHSNPWSGYTGERYSSRPINHPLGLAVDVVPADPQP